MECELCGQPTDSEALPANPEIHGNTYRLQLFGGFYRCSKTGIKFCVEAPLTIEYELASWQGHMDQKEANKYEIVGPLFSIKTNAKPGVVSAVYLPHYVCLENNEVDTSRFRIGHVKDDNMILETPTKIKPYYVMLENPTFSLLGVLYMSLPTLITKHIPIHGVVLVYCKCIKECTVHLYLMPDDISIKKAVDKKEKNNKFRRIDKPPQTKTLYTKNIYLVVGPHGVDINPKTLELRYNHPTELYPYSEMYIKGEEGTMIEIHDVGSKKRIWKSLLRSEEIMDRSMPLPGSLTAKESSCFIQKNFQSLCERISLLSPILVGLLQKGVINEHEEEMINKKTLRLEKNKALIEMILKKKAAEEFYQVLKENDCFLVEDLEAE
ncbi:caspase recruitment domain-containing protein 8 [Discoglossus pictus]